MISNIRRKVDGGFDCKVKKGALIIRAELSALPIVGSHFNTSLFEGVVTKVIVEKRNGRSKYIIIVE